MQAAWPRHLFRLVGALAAALLVSGCGQVLGVEEVAPDDGDGGGGGTGPGGGAPSGPAVGTGLPAATSSVDAAATATSGAGGGPASSAEASSGSGSSCGEALPPCAGAVPSTFDAPADLTLGFDVVAEKAESKDGRLELEPDDHVHAAVKSKAPVSVAPTIAACAVWVALEESDDDVTSGLAIGPGTPSEDLYRIERRGSVVSAVVGGVDVGQVPYVEGATRYLRIRFDTEDQVVFDVSSDGTCWTVVAGPTPSTGSEGLARLYLEADSGKSKLDDYCL